MAVHVTKNPKESVERLISRFNKKMQGSRMLNGSEETKISKETSYQTPYSPISNYA